MGVCGVGGILIKGEDICHSINTDRAPGQPFLSLLSLSLLHSVTALYITEIISSNFWQYPISLGTKY